jgi:hypothetical protein
MNDSNSLENQLRSWRLRQPSDAVKKNIFGSPERPERPVAIRPHWQSGWAAALASCAILLLTIVNVTHINGIAAPSGLIASAAISNASYAASFAAVQHNCLSAPIFGWTNDGELDFSNHSLDLLITNDLLR